MSIHTGSTTPEAELLLCCARTQADVDTAESIAELVQRGIDWDRAIRLAQLHGVTPLLYGYLDAHERQHVPTSVMQQLRHTFEINKNHNLFLTRELLRLIVLFEGQGIPVIPYKGPVLACLAYGNIGLRAFDDLDLFVHRKDVRRAKELLLARGYAPALQLNDVQEKIYLGSNYHYKFSDSIGFASVEIHWAVWKTGLSFTPYEADLWVRSSSTSLQGQPVLAPPPEDMLILACVHGTKHFWHSLNWICDVAELTRAYQTMDWGRLLARSRALGAENMLFLGLFLARSLLEAPLPSDISQMLRPQSEMGNLAAKIEKTLLSEMSRKTEDSNPFRVLAFDNYQDVLRSKERLRDRIRSVLWTALTPNLDDYRLLPMPAALTPLYYVVHPLRQTARHIWWHLDRRGAMR